MFPPEMPPAHKSFNRSEGVPPAFCISQENGAAVIILAYVVPTSPPPTTPKGVNASSGPTTKEFIFDAGLE